MCKGENQQQSRIESFCGSIKSFNTRRGFGFVSCEETAQRFGRDVYLSKDEAMMLADEPAVGLADDQNKAPPPVQEGDFLLFQVKLSTEGFPQAVQAQKIRRLRGVVAQAPSTTAEGLIVVTGDDDRAAVTSQRPDASLNEMLGADVRLHQTECGQLRLQHNDEVAFCCVNMTDSDGQYLEAQFIDLLHTSRADGSVLGCFSLSLPQDFQASSSTDDKLPNLELHGHALTTCILLSDVSSDLSGADLMRLFGKLGAVEARVMPAKGSACVTFNGGESIAKFLAQATHTVSENGITQLVHVSSCHYRKYGGYCCCCSSMPPTNQPTNNPCIVMEDFPQTKAPSAPLLSTPPMQPPIVQGSMNFGSFATQCLEQSTVGCFPTQCPEMTLLTRTSTCPDWRCMHSNIVIPSEAPEVLQIGDHSCGVCIQWPTVIHASGYVVELLDQVTMVAQRFMHGMPEGVLQPLLNLRVDGLQHSAYAACIRCVAPCGCESAPSQWSFVSNVAMAPAMYMSAPDMMPANMPSTAQVDIPPHACPPPPSAPPCFPANVTSMVPTPPLAPIPEEAIPMDSGCEDILTLD